MQLEEFRSRLDDSDPTALERARARLRAAQARPNARRHVPCGRVSIAVAGGTALACATAALLLGLGSAGGRGGLGPAPADASAVLAHAAAAGIEVKPGTTRTVPAPSSAGEDAVPWTLVSTRNGGFCGNTARQVFCASDRRSVQEGRASSTLYPPDRDFRRDASDRAIVTPSDGTGVRAGIAPSGVTHVVVVGPEGDEVRRVAVEHRVYEIVVPPQGSGSTVEFRDANGETVAVRRADG